MFKPVCYQLGRCPFKASFDRACQIRDRVEIRSKHGSNDSGQWYKPLMYSDPYTSEVITSEGIQTEEWLADPAAARMAM
jgi:hypothetical protein